MKNSLYCCAPSFVHLVLTMLWCLAVLVLLFCVHTFCFDVVPLNVFLIVHLQRVVLKRVSLHLLMCSHQTPPPEGLMTDHLSMELPTLSLSISQVLTLTRVSWASTPPRELILAACVHNLVLLVITQCS